MEEEEEGVFLHLAHHKEKLHHALFSPKSRIYDLCRPKVDHVEVDNLTFLLSCTGFGFTLIRIIQYTHNNKLALGFISHRL